MRELFKRVFKKEEGFSLIELIIVIAILAIIAAIAVPTLLGNIDKANKSTDTSNAKLIADAVAMAIAENPTLEGVDVSQVFDTSAGATDADDIIDGAIAKLNGQIPLIKAKDNGTGDEFFVILDGTTGAIEVRADAVGGALLFPN
ncbi:conserved protein of unknown function [Petrocella atlantisensis]|uniref:Prepilin-type N-terminal cleavage/methylation domain-containing protein n=1 Tax=Petrocella atlantisensis TaxID=2173034 RepID=A0A3P7P770_9FIRM|nr:prepilin-type N-terminal cleavage/methylation domain-containing protein [Petrocella atlantisensis]VDN49370.1 conserved protein of unknown function [Petrocella atlantisensis]